MADSAIRTTEITRPFSLQDFSIVEKILRNRYAFFEEIREGIGLREKMRAMLISSIIFFAIYGAVMGATHSLWQTLSSAIKLPILFIATLFVCVPSLYFFSLLFGSNQKPQPKYHHHFDGYHRDRRFTLRKRLKTAYGPGATHLKPSIEQVSHRISA